MTEYVLRLRSYGRSRAAWALTVLAAVCFFVATAGAAHANALPREIGVLVEQLPHVTSVMISARFDELDVTPSIGQVWYDGANYVVDVDFGSTGGAPGDEGWLLWTTIGRPEVGTHTLSVRHAGLGQILVSQLFETLPVGPLASSGSVDLSMFQMLGGYEFDPVGPEVYPALRAWIPADTRPWSSYGSAAAASIQAQPVPSPSPSPVPQPIGGCPDYPLSWRFVVANNGARDITDLAFDLSPPAGVALAPSSFASGVLAAGDSVAFETGVGASGSQGMRTIGYQLTYTGPGGLSSSISGDFPVAVASCSSSADPGQDRAHVSGRAPLAVRPGSSTFTWTTRTWDWAGEVNEYLPTEDDYFAGNLNIPPDELSGYVGVPTVIVQSIGGAVIGGVGKATFDLVAEGETSVGGVLAGAAAGAVVADIGPAIKVGQAVVKGVKAVGGFFKKLFSGPETLGYGPALVFEDLYYPEGRIDATLLDGTTESYKFTGRGDPIPGSPFGSTVNPTAALAAPHAASCAAGPDLKNDAAEIETLAWSWARGEDRSGCGVPDESALLEAVDAWAAGARATWRPAGAGRPASVRPALSSLLEPAAAMVAPGGTMVVRQRVEVVRGGPGVLFDPGLPAGWKIAPMERGGALFQRHGGRFLWLDLPAGAHDLVYKVGVPDVTPPGEYRLAGRFFDSAGTLLELPPGVVTVAGSPPPIPER